MLHPVIETSSQLRQRSKNHKKLQGTTAAPGVGSGLDIGVVTGMIMAPAMSEDDEEDESGDTVGGMKVIRAPLSSVVVVGVPTPVGSVHAPLLPETTVCPSMMVVDSTLDSACDESGATVVVSPFGNSMTKVVEIL